MQTGIVYTETVVHMAPERFATEVPYQVAIIELADGTRITARIAGRRVSIGERVALHSSPDSNKLDAWQFDSL